MARLHTTLRLEMTANITLTEAEVMALDGIFGYGADAFLKAFYREMGRAYVEPYENGVRSLHNELRGKLTPIIAEMKEIRARLAKPSTPASGE